jgi:hypothetical protein
MARAAEEPRGLLLLAPLDHLGRAHWSSVPPHSRVQVTGNHTPLPVRDELNKRRVVKFPGTRTSSGAGPIEI